ncbi:MAG: lytic transglycosylase domain-containing protein, partial [Bradyrhizobium sp.]
HSKWSYLDAAWILTLMKMESGYQPLVVNATGRQDGLMQVIPSTAAAMATLYGIPAVPQTDPMTSIRSGTACLDDSARRIIKERGVASLPLWDLVQAYNEGFGALEAGRLDPAYLTKFQLGLPIIQAQMAATAAMANNAKISRTPPMVRPS